VPKTTCRTRQLATLHKTGAALHRVGALDKPTMRDLDASSA
jgi:hypothetical protein